MKKMFLVLALMTAVVSGVSVIDAGSQPASAGCGRRC